MGRNSYVKRRGYSKRKTGDANDVVMAEALELPDVINQSTCWKAYHLEETQCCLHVPPNPKVKNCRNNPYCIHRIGLDKIEKLINQQTDTSTPNLVRRDLSKQPCGLVNFGNFCYVNSFLQIWYNDLVFRQCIYDWRSDPNFVPPDGTKMDVQAVMNCIQELFLTMQFTPYETTNALELIRLLKLDNEQHDVQEFNTLFFDALDRNLAYHPNGASVRRVIQSRFESKIRQTIKCDFCGSKNEIESEYRSLQISIEGHNSLVSAVNAFFSPENLSDYKCDGCQKSGCVTRYSQFSKLPPILVIQFNRYVFDSNGRHKKLKTAIQYPRTLSEKVLQGDLADHCNYVLSAVMIHEGPNTHCGHYYDFIKNPVDNQWFTYNDKNVVLAKPPGVNVEKESINRATTDMKECYALIYQRSNSNDGVTINNLRLPPPEIVVEIQKQLNDKFLKESKEGDISLNFWKHQVEKRHKFLQDLLNDLEVKNGKEIWRQDLAFLPITLLTEIIAKEYKAIKEMKEIAEFVPFKCEKMDFEDCLPSENNHTTNNNKETKFEKCLSIGSDIYYIEKLQNTKMSLCFHDRVSLDSIFKGDVKAVHKEAAERLIKYYKINLSVQLQQDEIPVVDFHKELRYSDVSRLKTGLDICVECVKLLKKDANFQKGLERTHELPVMRAIRQRTHNPRLNKPQCELPPPENALWVSERHLRLFKKLALEQMEHSKKLNKIFKYLIFSAENCSRTCREESDNSLTNNNTTNGKSSLISLLNNNGNSRNNDNDNTMEFIKSSLSPCSSNYSFRRRKRKLASGDCKNLKEGDELNRNDLGDSKSRSVSSNNSDECDTETENINGNRNGYNKPSTSKIDEDENENDGDNLNNSVLNKISKFNDELFCEHGSLTYMVRRTWVFKEEWDIICENFLEYCEPILCSASECSICVQNYVKNINEQKCFQDVFEGILAKIGKTIKSLERRKLYNSLELGSVYSNVLCKKFVRKFSRCTKTKNNKEIPLICQDCLFCAHGKPFIVLDEQTAGLSDCVPITNEEWRLIVDVYNKFTSHDYPTEVKLTEEGLYTNFCVECSNKHIENEKNKRFVYLTGEWIYVKLKADENEEKEKEAKFSSSSTMTTRRLASKRLLKFKLTSQDRIYDLKLRIYEQIRQSPSDQLLYLNDCVLENEQTLEGARVEANNIENPIVLIVQQCVEVSPSGEPRQLEKGFRDTALVI